MKRFLYSNYTKFIASVLFVVFVFATVIVVTDTVIEFAQEGEYVYNFENEFLEARCFLHLMQAPSFVVSNAYYASADEKGKVDIAEIEKYMEQTLNDLYCDDRINYFIEWKGKTFSNCGAENAEEVPSTEIYCYEKITPNGRNIYEHSQNYGGFYLEELRQFDEDIEIEVYVSVKEEHIEEYRKIWTRQKEMVEDAFVCSVALLSLALIMLIYLVAVCGKDKKGECKRSWIDHIWIEASVAFGIGVCLFAILIYATLMEAAMYGNFPYSMAETIMCLLAVCASSVFLSVLLSVVRNIKCKSIISSSIIAKIVVFVWHLFIRIIKKTAKIITMLKNNTIRILSKKTSVILIGMLFIYTALMGIFGMMTMETPFGLVFGFLLFLAAAFVVGFRAMDIDEIKKGIHRIREGDIAYKIPNLKSDDMKLLAEDINSIGNGLEKSVAEKMKAERMKTELITNVSHDLKTPVTSIISYTELLSKIEGLPEEAKDYISVISRKSERLKNLTEDLFDISKVQSGNEKISVERLDIGLLVNQALGEHNSDIAASGLNFCVNVEKELFVKADGRKMSRVIENLLSNALKYSMKNTRVFVAARKNENEVMVEMKNIASYEMKFDANEITDRFVRGDESRTQDGNGLGLAIAKSYTEACGGKFEVVTDGDLFKAIIRFNKVL